MGGKEYWNGTKHAFNLNFNVSNPEVNGIHGIEAAYVASIKNQIFALSGPTIFEPILEKAASIAQIAHNNTIKDKINNAIQYFILLIITDGVITDMKQTKNKIVQIANQYLPLSIIIVGVGNANFSMMNELDGDENGLMDSNGKYAKRDVVQFVPMNKYENNLNGLSKETLYEIPNQFLSYTRFHDIKPGKRIIPKMQIIDNQFEINDDDEGDHKEKDTEILQQPIDDKDNVYWDNVPLPTGWERAYDENGRTYYVDNVHQTTQWKHPNA